MFPAVITLKSSLTEIQNFSRIPIHEHVYGQKPVYE